MHPLHRTLKVVAGIAASFIVLAGTIIFLSQAEMIGFEMSMLMLAALVGIYVGTGIIVAVYLLIAKLD